MLEPNYPIDPLLSNSLKSIFLAKKQLIPHQNGSIPSHLLQVQMVQFCCNQWVDFSLMLHNGSKVISRNKWTFSTLFKSRDFNSKSYWLFSQAFKSIRSFQVLVHLLKNILVINSHILFLLSLHLYLNSKHSTF